MMRSITLRRWRLACLGVAALSALGTTAGVRAQSPQTLEAFAKGPHLGTVEDALVGLIVTNKANDGSLQTRHGNGLMLRSDGFIVAPAALFNTRNVAGAAPNLPNQSLTVVLYPGTAREQRVSAHRPNWYGYLREGNPRYALRYAVFKLDNVHVPALRTLLPDTLEPGNGVQVAWSAWDDATRRFQVVQIRQNAIGKHGPQPAGDKTPLSHILQSTPFARPLEAVTPGALVIGPDNLAVGLVAGSAPANAASFANFDSLHLATNCVTPLPLSDTDFTHKVWQSPGKLAARRQAVNPNAAKPDPNKPTVTAPGMVAVPGGPVRLPASVQALQWDMERSTTACVAPFLIDQYEVTNEQYWEFWQSLPEKMRNDAGVQADMYPIGWGPPSAPFPAELEQVPVLGVRLPGARAYAKWAGKRLPTPYEWSLAAFGPSGGNEIPEWGRKFLKQRQEVWQKIVQAHLQYARENPQILPRLEFMMYYKYEPAIDRWIWTRVPDRVEVFKDNVLNLQWSPDHPIPFEFFRLPWFFFRDEFVDAATWSRQTVEELTEPLFTEWIDPMYVLPVGSRPYDVSPYGAYDMVMNAEELIAPAPFFPWNRPPANHWPYVEADRYMHVEWTVINPLEHTTQMNGGYLEWSTLPAVNSAYSTSLPYARTLLANPEVILLGNTFLDNNMALWQNMGEGVNTGFHRGPAAVDGMLQWGDLQLNFGVDEIHANPGDHSAFIIFNRPTRADAPFDALAFLWEISLNRSDYTTRRMSRRIRSASENARPNSDDYYPADEGAYMTVCAAMDEYSELLRPANTMVAGLRVGPTYNSYLYPAGGTTFHDWKYIQDANVLYPRKGTPRLVGKSEPRLVDTPHIVDGTAIAKTGSFSAWRGQPRHYHTEMGRPIAVDHDRAFNQRASLGYPIPDTFLVPGGFRCVR
jgi:formylglycine-generating enzyme required for sulfatase activity